MTSQSMVTSLRDAVTDLTVILPPLQHAVSAQKASRKGEGRRPQPGSKPPWNSQAAAVYMDIHYGVREIEQNLRYATSGVLRTRGASAANTITALEAIIPLAAGADYYAQVSAYRKINGWVWRGKVALGETEPLQHLPRDPGQPAARCKWCTFTTLRMRPLDGLVKCINPGCTDGEGRRPVATVEIGPHFGQSLLVWQDGSIGLEVAQKG